MPRRQHRAVEIAGFDGGVPIAELSRSCAVIPDAPGVYLVVAPEGFEARFLRESSGGRFKGREPSVPVEKLHACWVPESSVLYIGKATRLQTRIKQYLRFGAGQRAPHWGGRHIWQLDHAQELLFYWKPTPADDPRDVERSVLALFREQYGRLPFANMRV